MMAGSLTLCASSLSAHRVGGGGRVGGRKGGREGGKGRERERGGRGNGREGGRNRLVGGQGSYTDYEFGSRSDVTVHFSLPGCKPELQMMYAGSKNSLVSDGGFTKVKV